MTFLEAIKKYRHSYSEQAQQEHLYTVVSDRVRMVIDAALALNWEDLPLKGRVLCYAKIETHDGVSPSTLEIELSFVEPNRRTGVSKAWSVKDLDLMRVEHDLEHMFRDLVEGVLLRSLGLPVVKVTEAVVWRYQWRGLFAAHAARKR